jgi:hypothetical protein
VLLAIAAWVTSGRRATPVRPSSAAIACYERESGVVLGEGTAIVATGRAAMTSGSLRAGELPS